MSAEGENLDVQKIRIYLLPLTVRSLKWASMQKFCRTRLDGVLVMTDQKPEINGATEIQSRGMLSKEEQEWVCAGLAEVMYGKRKKNRFEEFWRFLDRLETALNEMEKGGVQSGERDRREVSGL